MNAWPEMYYEIEYRQHERALENAAAYRRAAELSPAQVVPYVSVFSRALTNLKGYINRRRKSRRARAAAASTPSTASSHSAPVTAERVPAPSISASPVSTVRARRGKEKSEDAVARPRLG